MEDHFANSAKIERDEQARRVRAGRILTGHEDQRRFAEFADIPFNALRAYEQGARGVSPRDRGQLVKAMGLPERWFTAPLAELVARPAEGTSEPGLAARLDGLEAKLDHLTETVDALLRDALERLLGEAPQQPSVEKSNGPESAAMES